MGFGTGAHPGSTNKKRGRELELQGSLEKRKRKLDIVKDLRDKSMSKALKVERHMVLEASMVENFRGGDEDLGLMYHELTGSSKLLNSQCKPHRGN